MLNLQALNKASRAMKYAQGTAFNEKGDDKKLYIILQGEVGVIVSRPGEHRLAEKLGPGSFFGEAALFLHKKASNSFVALTDIIALPVDASTAQDFFREEPAIAYELCRALCERLYGADTASAKPAQKAAPAPAAPKSEKPAKKAAPERPASPKAEKPTMPKPAPQASAPSVQKPRVQPPVQSGAFPLFPEGHTASDLMLNNDDREHLMEKEGACPLCKRHFHYLAIRPSKLMLDSTDSDMRQRYKGIEPLYYEVITCPHCLYSALSDTFSKPVQPKPGFDAELKAIRQSTDFKFSMEKDSDQIFASYYLALFCAPYCVPKHQMTTAKLLLKLSRVYQDGGNSELETQTAQQALDSYMFVYQNIETTPAQDQQLCLVIGELNLKLGHVKEAKDFFFKAKVNRAGAPLLKRQAEDRLFDIRETEH